MKSTLLLSTCLLLVASTGIVINQHNVPVQMLSGDQPESNSGEAGARYEWELMRLADPATGKIPPGIRKEELAFASTIPALETFASFSNGRTSSTSAVVARGPWNVGGRTRAIAIDITNPNHIFAGSVNGGLWRSTDAGVTWIRVSPLGQNPAITCIAQDKRTGHTNTWYYSTGEGYGTSASATGAFYLGNGLYKSTDGGLTWNLLAATASNTPHIFDSYMDIIWKIALDSSDNVNDVVYIACYGIVYKSTNGGTNFTLVRGDVAAPSYFTDVAVAPSGIVYVTESSDGAQKGIWRKSGAGPWTKISTASWDTSTVNRVVIGVDPTDENRVYFLGETPNTGKMTTNYRGDQEWNSLLKYRYVSGNGAGTGGSWTDLSPSIPYDSSELGNFNSQGGYDLVVSVHPNDSNVVFIGGTNLFRSTDGFTTMNNTTEIGGYDPTSTLPFYVNYLNHHSDQHNIVFYPSNPDSMLQSNDGGIYRTANNLATPVVWQPLNDGYVTSQFYTVALDHGPVANDIVIGGLQDNGTWFTNNTNLTTAWTQPGWGDGAYCAIDDGHQYYYTSRQQGRTVKEQCDANGNPLAFQRIDPIGGDNYLFINPFVLDPNNNNRMYLAAGNKVWRNDSLNLIPLLGQWDSITTGWTRLQDTIPVAATVVTSMAVSRTPANRLYYGTSKQKVYRVDNAQSANPVTTDITASTFNVNGNVSCIAIDPNDADKVLVVFSNYRVYSLFYSTNGGMSFTKTAGNLEIDTSGGGAGPSLRWASIVPTPNGNVYLLGTSTGLYGTNQLNGFGTVWTQLSPNEIGYMVVDMMDYRISDGYVVIGTHGAGVFSMTLTDTLMTSAAITDPFHFDVQVFPNPASDVLTIRFTLLKPEKVHIGLYDASGKKADDIADSFLPAGSQRLAYRKHHLPAGIYFIKIEGEEHAVVKKVILTE